MYTLYTRANPLALRGGAARRLISGYSDQPHDDAGEHRHHGSAQRHAEKRFCGGHAREAAQKALTGRYLSKNPSERR
jgi:hypothetical protein